MASNTLVTPKRGDPFVDRQGLPHFEPQRWLEEVSRRVNQDFATIGGLQDQITAIEIRVTELEPNYIVITSADSPYTAANNDYILCDMDGDIDIVFPDDGRFFVSRKGQSFDLTLLETVSGKVSPKILFDRSTAAIAKIVDDWRFV